MLLCYILINVRKNSTEYINRIKGGIFKIIINEIFIIGVTNSFFFTNNNNYSKKYLINIQKYVN